MSLILLLFTTAWSHADNALRLYPGFVTKVRCEGRLLLSSVGDDRLVRLEALPRELGCGVILKPMGPSGRTNLILETSAGTARRIVVVTSAGSGPSSSDLTAQLKGIQE